MSWDSKKIAEILSANPQITVAETVKILLGK